MITLLASVWPYLLAALSIVGGLTAALFARKTVQTAKAQVSAAQSDAVAQVKTAQTSEAQANEAAAQTGAAAVAARTEIENAVAAKPATEVRNELQDWTKP